MIKISGVKQFIKDLFIDDIKIRNKHECVDSIITHSHALLTSLTPYDFDQYQELLSELLNTDFYNTLTNASSFSVECDNDILNRLLWLLSSFNDNKPT
jgi:hypothetical protein